jgi:hypothetical protein
MAVVAAPPPPAATEKVAELRRLIDEVGLCTTSQLAAHWGVTLQAVHDMFSKAGAPAPVLDSGRTRLYALPEAEAYRASRRLRRGH